ncbi:MAG: hypothetical protein HQL87_06175 [Magnetococcales bacterium]|nr:hypothetical protein [Magnetococcales bacterium]
MREYRFALPADTAEQMHQALHEVQSVDELQKVQCILLRAELNLSPRQIASVTGLPIGAVWRLHSAYLRHGVDAIRTETGRGGRHHAYLGAEEEKIFLETLLGPDRNHLTRSIPTIKKAFEKRIGKVVNKSTIYNMLHRHGWQVK